MPALPWLVCAAVVAIWELCCYAFAVPEFILPRPSRITAVLIASAGPIWFHTQHTLITTIIGFALSVAVGLMVGIAVGSSKLIYGGFYPLLVGFNSVPKVALVPVLVVWFGIGTIPAVLTAFLMSFFPIVVNVATGLATVEPELHDVLRSLGRENATLSSKSVSALAPVFLRFTEGGGDACLRRLDYFGIHRLERRHRHVNGAGRE